MQAPAVQYVTTEDGYDIAYWVTGEGRTLLYMPGQFSDLNAFWSEPFVHGRWSQGLAARFRLIQFDGRGQGMSTRGIREPQTIESLTRDLRSVAKQAAPAPFMLLARWHGCHVAIRYAVAHPDRVLALILIACAEENGAWPSSVYQDLPQQNWEVFLRSQMPRDVPRNEISARVERTKGMSTQNDLALRAAAYSGSNVADALPQVNVPTLVIHPRDYVLLPATESMKVAARIPGARFAFSSGDMLPGDADTGIRAIEEFLSEIPGLTDGLTPRAKQSASTAQHPQLGHLSARQLQVLQLIAQGKTNREIAAELVLSERTVQRHIADLYLKIDVRNRSEATSFALSKLP